MFYQNSEQQTDLLITEVSKGNEGAFGQLLKKYDNQVSGYIQRFTKSEELTREMVQDVFLKIWMNRSSLTEIGSFKSYLFIVARNHTFDCLKQISRKKKRENEWIASVINHPPNDHGEAATDRSYERIQEAVMQLPPQQKKIYIRRRDGMKQAEIAQELSLSVGTVKKHLMLATRFLKNQLKPQATVVCKK